MGNGCGFSGRFEVLLSEAPSVLPYHPLPAKIKIIGRTFIYNSLFLNNNKDFTQLKVPTKLWVWEEQRNSSKSYKRLIK
jgi:hypothetical protein